MESGGYKQRTQNLDLVKLDSCFGGLAIYKYEFTTIQLHHSTDNSCSLIAYYRSHAIDQCEYHYRYSDPPHMLDCEHVIFNKCAMQKNAARIVTNMNM